MIPQGIIISAINEALRRVLEVSEDTGRATGGSNTTLEDTTKNWETNMWVGATIHIFKNGVEYLRSVTANTNTVITFTPLPTGIDVAAGDGWAVRRPIAVTDISDRIARELGIIDNLRKWGGTNLTGRDISLDLANLDIALSALRDALRGTGVRDFTTLETDIESILARLDVALSTRAEKAQLPSTLTTAGNLKTSLEEQAIALGVDVQARYSLLTREVYTPAIETFYLPSAGSIDLSNFLASTWYIYATAGATGAEKIDCYLQISLDGGVNFWEADGYQVLNADFKRGKWNSIHAPIMLAQARLKIVITTEAPGALEAAVIRKA